MALRPTAKRESGRLEHLALLRVLFVVLVGLNLTVVCQGHQRQGRHFSDAHITLLGEPDDEADIVVIATSANGSSTTLGIESPGKALEIPDLAGLGFVLLVAASAMWQAMELWLSVTLRRKSQVALGPQAPPPR